MQNAVTVESEYFPPSVNSLFANVSGKGRVRTKRYRDWASAAGWDCQRKGSIHGPFVVRLILSRKKRRKGQDLDNLIKAVMDLMVTHGIVDSDSLCEQITVAWGDCAGFSIEITEWAVLPSTKEN